MRAQRARLPPLLVVALLAVCCCVVCTAPLPAHGMGIYVKLFPGRQMCVNYVAPADAVADGPVKVGLVHRCLDSRLIGIRTWLYAPNATAPGERGALLPLRDTLNPFGAESHLYFDAHEAGTYTLCFRTPLRHPIVRFEMHFVSTVDEVDTPVADDGVAVVDKPIVMADYQRELQMLETSMESLLDSVRSLELRHHLFHRITRRTLYIVCATTLLNVGLAIGASLVSERLLERYAVKQKLA